MRKEVSCSFLGHRGSWGRGSQRRPPLSWAMKVNDVVWECQVRNTVGLSGIKGHRNIGGRGGRWPPAGESVRHYQKDLVSGGLGHTDRREPMMVLKQRRDVRRLAHVITHNLVVPWSCDQTEQGRLGYCILCDLSPWLGHPAASDSRPQACLAHPPWARSLVDDRLCQGPGWGLGIGRFLDQAWLMTCPQAACPMTPTQGRFSLGDCCLPSSWTHLENSLPLQQTVSEASSLLHSHHSSREGLCVPSRGSLLEGRQLSREAC